jgi:hypothetical protein
MHRREDLEKVKPHKVALTRVEKSKKKNGRPILTFYKYTV